MRKSYWKTAEARYIGQNLLHMCGSTAELQKIDNAMYIGLRRYHKDIFKRYLKPRVTAPFWDSNCGREVLEALLHLCGSYRALEVVDYGAYQAMYTYHRDLLRNQAYMRSKPNGYWKTDEGFLDIMECLGEENWDSLSQFKKAYPAAYDAFYTHYGDIAKFYRIRSILAKFTKKRLKELLKKAENYTIMSRDYPSEYMAMITYQRDLLNNPKYTVAGYSRWKTKEGKRYLLDAIKLHGSYKEALKMNQSIPLCAFRQHNPDLLKNPNSYDPDLDNRVPAWWWKTHIGGRYINRQLKLFKSISELEVGDNRTYEALRKYRPDIADQHRFKPYLAYRKSVDIYWIDFSDGKAYVGLSYDYENRLAQHKKDPGPVLRHMQKGNKITRVRLIHQKLSKSVGHFVERVILFQTKDILLNVSIPRD